MELHPDFSDLLAAFAAADVRFALLGGYAVAYYGKPRATKDLDLLVSGSEGNPERVCAALESFGAPANVVAAARVQADSEVVFLGVPPVRIDILRSVDGLDTEDALDRAETARVGALRIPILCLADLLTNKRASGRPQDIADVAMLEAARRVGEEGVPRAHFDQDSEFLTRELSGRAVQSLLSFGPDNDHEMLWLRPQGRAWQRFWLEDGFVWWEELRDDDVWAGYEEVRSDIVDVGAHSGLVGEIIDVVEARCTAELWWLEIRLASGRCVRVDAEQPRGYDTRFRLQVLVS